MGFPNAYTITFHALQLLQGVFAPAWLGRRSLQGAPYRRMRRQPGTHFYETTGKGSGSGNINDFMCIKNKNFAYSYQFHEVAVQFDIAILFCCYIATEYNSASCLVI